MKDLKASFEEAILISSDEDIKNLLRYSKSNNDIPYDEVSHSLIETIFKAKRRLNERFKTIKPEKLFKLDEKGIVEIDLTDSKYNIEELIEKWFLREDISSKFFKPALTILYDLYVLDHLDEFLKEHDF